MPPSTPSAPFEELALTSYPAEPSVPGFDPAFEGRDVLDSLPGMIADATAGMSGTITPRDQNGLNVRQQVRSLIHWVHVAVDRIATGVASQDILVKLAATDGSGGSDVADPSHPLVQLLESPNPFATRNEFWIQTVQYLELTGNAIFVKETNARGQVLELWNLPMQFVKPVVDSQAGLIGIILEDGQGGEIPIPIEDIIHLKYPNPENRVWGLSKLAAAANDMRLVDRIHTAQLAAFDNDVWASLILRTDKALDKDAYKRVMAIVRQRYSGVSKAGMPMVFDNNLQPDRLRNTPAEMGFQESVKMTRDSILAIFGVPPILAGEVGSANRSNAEAQERIFQKYTIAPKLKLIEQGLNARLVRPNYDKTGRLFVEFTNPVPEDELIAIKRNVANISSGVVSPNEIREEIGVDPAPWGELPQWVHEFQAVHGYLPGEEPPEVPEPAEGTPSPQDGEDDDDVGTQSPPNTDDDARQLIRKAVTNELVARNRKQGADNRRLRLAMRSNLLKRIETEQDDLMVSAQRTIKKYFVNQSKRIQERVREQYAETAPIPEVKNVRRVFLGEERLMLYPDGSTFRAKRPEGEPITLGEAVDTLNCYDTTEVANVQVRMLPADQSEHLDDWNAASEDLAARMNPKLSASLEAGGALQYDALGTGGTFTLNNPKAEAWLQLKQRDYWRGTVNTTTQNLLSQKLAEVMAEGPTPDKLAKAVEGVMDGRIKSSAATIARTETAGAYNAAGLMAREDAGVKEQEWIATFDSRVRATHRAADGQKVAVGEKFTVGGALLRYPGDPQGPVAELANCRCTVVALDAGDDVGADQFVDPVAEVSDSDAIEAVGVIDIGVRMWKTARNSFTGCYTRILMVRCFA